MPKKPLYSSPTDISHLRGTSAFYLWGEILSESPRAPIHLSHKSSLISVMKLSGPVE